MNLGLIVSKDENGAGKEMMRCNVPDVCSLCVCVCVSRKRVKNVKSTSREFIFVDEQGQKKVMRVAPSF